MRPTKFSPIPINGASMIRSAGTGRNNLASSLGQGGAPIAVAAHLWILIRLRDSPISLKLFLVDPQRRGRAPTAMIIAGASVTILNTCRGDIAGSIPGRDAHVQYSINRSMPALSWHR